MKLKPLYAFVAAVILTVSTVYFIRKSNDHLECTETMAHTTNAAGNQVTTKQRVCQERFNF